MELNRIINDDCLDFLKKEVKNIKNPVIVSDPPFNIGYHYKTYNDKRIIKRIEEGKTGCKLYDWWNINQVKNISKQKNKTPLSNACRGDGKNNRNPS